MSDIDSVIARFAAAQHGVVAARQIVDADVSEAALRRRVADRRLRRIHRGVYAVGPQPLTLRGRWMAATLACGDNAALSHVSAGALLDIRATSSSLIHVTVAGPSRRRRRDNLRIHTLRTWHPHDVTDVDGVRVTSPERTLLDLAATLSLTQLRRAYEQAERLRILDHARLAALAARTMGRPGIAVLRRVAGIDPEPGTRLRSELERAFRDLVEASHLPPYLPNTVVAGHDVDAYWPQARLVVELQSRTWHTDPEVFEADHAKRAELMAAGQTVLALTYEQVTQHARDTARTLARLLAVIAI